MYTYLITLSYSKYDMDKWEDGTEVSFKLDTNIKLNKKKLYKAGYEFLESTELDYREAMCRVKLEGEEGYV